MFWPNLVFRRERLLEETNQFYLLVTGGLASVLLLGAALHALLFWQRVTYVPLFESTVPAGDLDRAARVLDREEIGYLVADGGLLVPRASRQECLVKVQHAPDPRREQLFGTKPVFTASAASPVTPPEPEAPAVDFEPAPDRPGFSDLADVSPPIAVGGRARR